MLGRKDGVRAFFFLPCASRFPYLKPHKFNISYTRLVGACLKGPPLLNVVYDSQCAHLVITTA